MGVGMGIDFGLLSTHGPVIAALVLGLLLVKTAILWVLCRGMGVGRSDATRVSLLLSQSGEFGFVLFGLAAVSGLLPEELFHMLTLLVALTMVTTPLMANLGDYLDRRLTRTAPPDDLSKEHIDAGRPHVIIAGFGRVGRRVARVLEAANVPYLAVDINADRVLEGRRNGFPVFYGDATQVDLLKAAGAAQAGALVCTLDRAVPAVKMVSILRQHYTEIAIHARRGQIWDDYRHGEPLHDSHRLALLDEHLYFPDGQIKDEVYVYGSFIQSRMYAAGEVAEAIDVLEAVLQREGGSRDVRLAVVDMYREQGEAEKAALHLQQLRQRYPDDPVVRELWREVNP